MKLFVVLTLYVLILSDNRDVILRPLMNLTLEVMTGAYRGAIGRIMSK